MKLKLWHILRIVSVANRLGIAARPFLWIMKLIAWLIPPGICARWVVKLVVKLIAELAKTSREDADAMVAMSVLNTVHGAGYPGGGFPMFRSRIVSEMGREPDEEQPYYSSVSRGNMNVFIYRLPNGYRIWFNQFGDDSVVGAGIRKPGQSDDDMFWSQNRRPHATESARSLTGRTK